ncbi:cytochrome c, class I [Caballeronia sordidicola]|uniref:Cytochrome c, class I n=1 Tax=Caballeronia sordidicola TaxID=196367 RepID=A0A158GSA6_CABSO|nr:c-type cytochrome [Caballeronia sordidicola]SAL34968.1 cytochrome c, class I [Caballeronia sordidicola]
MNEERLFSLRNRWFTVTVGGMLALVLLSAGIGFIWLPSAQKDQPFQGVWNAICSAAGVPQQWLRISAATPVPLTQTSLVAMTPQLLGAPSSASIGRGATLALRCTMCHGAVGVSDANTPNLAGQFSSVIYKQLLDFQSGARRNAVMSPMVANLSDQEMRDLSAYYAYLPKPVASRSDAQTPVSMPDIVAHGAPMRNIASCASCHGGIDHKAGTPWLEGMPYAYTKGQLQAFADGTRHNDISEQMRNVARNMTAEEIDAAARFYAGVQP